tara:strand:- start:141 stop:254 length:114 start_codon:yes stop_codon:yes gene_type:complete
VAERLGVSVLEVYEYPVELFAAWLAFFKVKNDLEKKS